MSTRSLFTPRLVFGAVFIACLGLVLGALFLQHEEGLEPCPLCILQRYAFVAVGIVAFLGALHNPKGKGARFYATLVAVAALAGGGVAVRQSWLQHNPPVFAECGPGLETIVDSFPLAEALPMIFRGSGDCSKVDWTFLGLSIAEWALIAFAATLVAVVLVWVNAGRARRN
ncbi:MAG: disulfide bond formation protein B [Betaproteobacteria bacterium]|nr:disulfide bond formation protein B [Betaproteobacteria bacterium]